MVYTVKIREILERKVAVEASTPEEAWEQVANQYCMEKIVLDADDFTEYSISVEK